MTPASVPSQKGPAGSAAAGKYQLRLAGVIDILLDAARNFRRNGDINQAAAISLYSLLSLVPLLILTMIAVGHLLGASPGRLEVLSGTISDFYPSFSEGFFDRLGDIEEKKRILGGIGIVSLLWLSSLVIRTVEIALNGIFRTPGRRKYLISITMAVGMITVVWMAGLMMIMIRITHALAVTDPFLVSWFIERIPPAVRYLIGYAIPYLAITTVVALSYLIIPKKKVPFLNALIGAVIFTLLMAAAKTVFAWYLANYARYSVIYGSFEVAVVLLIWVFYLALIFLFCAEIVSSYRRRDLILLEEALLKNRHRFLRTGDRLYRKFGQVYPVGAYLFQEREEGRHLYYILSGRIQIEKRAQGATQVLSSLGPGEYLGEMAALIDQPRSASARVVEPAAVAVIPGETFKSLLRDSDELALTMLKELAMRLAKTNTVVDELGRSLLKLFVVAYFCIKDKDSAKDPAEAEGDLERLTGKGGGEIARIMALLEKEGIIDPQTRPPFINREKAWEIISRGIR